MKFEHTNVLKPEPNQHGDITISWNLGFRAVVASRHKSDLTLGDGSWLYQAVFDFQNLPDSERYPMLMQEWDIQPCESGGLTMTLPSGNIIVLGLGLRIDFGSLNWVLGSISLRRPWLLRGLMVVNSNNPIYGHSGSTEEIVAFLKNNAPTPVALSCHERPFQIHFQQVLVSPNVELCWT